MEDNSHETQNEPKKIDPTDEPHVDQPAVGQVVEPTANPETPIASEPAAVDEKPANEESAFENAPKVDLQSEEPQTTTPETPVVPAANTVSVISDQPVTPVEPSKKKPILTIIMSALLVIAIGAAGFFALSSINANSDIEALEGEVAALSATTHELPDSAIKLSECVPNMGFHYLIEGGDPKFGPFYLVNKAGEVIGVEVKYIDDSFTVIPESPIPLAVINPGEPFDLFNWTYEHLEISKALEGHEGFLEDHIDVHAYTVTPEEQAQACQ